MKNKIIINISKDTPTETLSGLCAALKQENEKNGRKKPLYALNEDVEKLHERYEELFKQVKTSQNLSEKQVEKECETLSRKYDFELEVLSKWRKVEYDKRQAEIKAREAEQTPWRRCWLWRLLFRPLTNRAQDIIEARAELEADIEHTALEKEIENDRKEKLPQDDGKKFSKRKARAVLKTVIKNADTADMQEVFAEPQDVPPVQVQEPAQENASKPAPQQLPGQMTLLDDVQEQPKEPQNPPPFTSGRRPRPPRSCRRP